jgi:uncharacterized protein YggE
MSQSLFAEGGLPDNPYIYIEGTAEIQKPADIVTLRFEVVSRAADQPKANEQLQAGATKVFGVLNESKITEADVIAETIRTGPNLNRAVDRIRIQAVAASLSATSRADLLK